MTMEANPPTTAKTRIEPITGVEVEVENDEEEAHKTQTSTYKKTARRLPQSLLEEATTRRN